MIKILFTISLLWIGVYAEEVYESYYIKDNGKKIKIKTKITSHKLNKIQITKDGKKFSKDVNIIVKFNKKTDIEEFCKKYQLEVTYKMITGHYILKNNSKVASIKLIKQIMDAEVSVSTILPNWKLNQKMQ